IGGVEFGQTFKGVPVYGYREGCRGGHWVVTVGAQFVGDTSTKDAAFGCRIIRFGALCVWSWFSFGFGGSTCCKPHEQPCRGKNAGGTAERAAPHSKCVIHR